MKKRVFSILKIAALIVGISLMIYFYLTDNPIGMSLVSFVFCLVNALFSSINRNNDTEPSNTNNGNRKTLSKKQKLLAIIMTVWVAAFILLILIFQHISFNTDSVMVSGFIGIMIFGIVDIILGYKE